MKGRTCIGLVNYLAFKHFIIEDQNMSLIGSLPSSSLPNREKWNVLFILYVLQNQLIPSTAVVFLFHLNETQILMGSLYDCCRINICSHICQCVKAHLSTSLFKLSTPLKYFAVETTSSLIYEKVEIGIQPKQYLSSSNGIDLSYLLSW